MRSLLTRAALALTVLVALAPAPAPAFDGRGCGGNWSGSASCNFTMVGSPIFVRGDAQRAGTASLRVWITPRNYPEVPLLSCEASGSGFARCDLVVGQEASQLLPPALHQIALSCHVQGAGAGEYFCGSGPPE